MVPRAARCSLALALLAPAALAEGSELEPIVRTGHDSAITGVAVSPDGRLVATSSFDKTVKLWDPDTGLEVGTLRGHYDFVLGVAFHPDGSVVSAGLDGAVRQWDLEAMKEKERWVLGGELRELEVSPDGSSYVVRKGQESVLRSFAKDARAEPLGVDHAHLSPDGARYAGLRGEKIYLLDLATRRELRTFGEGWSVAWRDAHTLLVSRQTSVSLFDAETGKELRRLASGSLLALSRDLRFAATWAVRPNKKEADEGTVVVWDLDTGKSTARIAVATSNVTEVRAAAFTADGTRLVVGRADGVLRIYDLATKKDLTAGVELPAKLDALQFTRDGRLLGVRSISPYGRSTGGRVLPVDRALWDVGRGRPQPLAGKWESHYPALLSADGSRAALGAEDGARVFDALTGRLLLTRKGEGVQALSGDGSVLATTRTRFVGHNTYECCDIRFVQTAKGTASRVLDASPTMAALDFGGSVFAYAEGSNVTTVDPVTAKVLAKVPARGMFDARWASGSFGGDGRTYRSMQNGKLLELAGGALKSTDVPGKYGVVSDDGRLAATDAGLFEVATQKRLGGFEGMRAPFAFDPKGVVLLAGTRGDAIHVLRTRDGALLGRLYAFGTIDWVVVAPDGRFDGTEGGIAALAFAASGRAVPLSALYARFHTPKLLDALIAGDDAPRDLTAVDAIPASSVLRPPPRLVWRAPAHGAVLESETLEATVEVEAGVELDQVRLFLNGKLVEESTRGLKRLERNAKTFTVTLVPGENVLRASAFTSDRVEGVAEVRVTRKGAEPKSTLYLVAVGINDYENPKYQLGFGRPDAEALVKALGAGGARIFQRVEKTELYDRTAGRAAMVGALEKIAAAARPEDVFVMFYAGHGVTGEDGEFYLVPWDVTALYGDVEQLKARGVSAGLLRALVAKIPARKQLVLLDACESGRSLATFAMRGAAEEKAIHQLASSAGTAVLASTGSDQLAAEVKALGHGIFTYALLEGLKGKADGAPKDGKITVKELEAYLEARVPELTREHRGAPQYPNAFALGQDFPVAVAP